MPDIHIERNHTLGIAGAREVARQWVQQVEEDYGLECTYTEGKTCDVAQFSRPGIDGTVEVTASTFKLEATLGFLFSSFSEQIEQKISRNLDELLDAPNGGTRFA
ncbi:putative polyhydroxyalkanoate system protein [Variovorax boronicumulans]|uniref:polyhydroxyalkanoic acid system family protein n=1 Tax=Variovorax boronicumulans TaxID=436515 RepID=UPI00278244BE|nr:polyhydroxyalkanoic acid system family protein [Variovorax boronicumulans]MDQ0014808.1 putative polyhydroxyalkanoate system protein [Variovorax boronicumulans]